MAEITDNSITKASITLSRNSPVALVVGAASFLGSHLSDILLEKNIQVVGVDDLEQGKKQNLQKAAGNKNFHLIIESPDKLEADLVRLDYIFILPAGKWNLGKILDLFKSFGCRCLFVSSIDLYEKDNESERMGWLKETERKIAKFASEYNLNARILRLGSVYGPRMDFQTKDPLVRLIQQSLTGNLQKDVPLEFSSRAMYVADAVDLIIKTIFVGATAQKIFDGVGPVPVKVTEIKQVLLDPVWYETRDFAFTQLPPWPTPNLEKTIRILNWHPKDKLVTDLKETLSYFKDNEVDIPEPEIESEESGEAGTVEDREQIHHWDEEKKKELEAFKQKSRQTEKKKKGIITPKLPLQLSKIYLFIVIVLVTYALIWPVVSFGWGVLAFYNQLNEGLMNLKAGKFEKSLGDIREADAALTEVKSTFDTLEPVRRTGFLKREFEKADNLFDLSNFSLASVKDTISGIQALLKSLNAITGEGADSPASYFTSAQVELGSAGENLSKTYAILKEEDFNKNLPSGVRQKVTGLSEKLALLDDLVVKAKAVSILLPKLVALDGTKNYLVLLQNNMELRPGGGFIGSFAKVSFERGKLKKLDVNDIYAIDGQLSIHVEPPKEIKEDLGQNNWYLRDSNWESDFPTGARQAQWFYAKETGERVAGVVALDISAMEELLPVIGPLDLADYKEKITAENLFERAITHAELSFFPGSQAKKSFLTALSNQLFNKIFFLPQNNWPGIISALGKSLDEKHISIYLDDPRLFSYLGSQGWTHSLPRPSDQEGDFLSLVEANLGANKVNYYLDRTYNLETTVGKEGEVKQRMRVSYTNRSPSDVFPGGRYKNRMRVYLPFGAKLTKALWGESDITKNVTGFVDYGRSGYSMLLELAPKEQKTLVLDYSVPVKLEFKDGKANYRLDIIKQAGTFKDPFEWRITYPLSFQLVSEQTKKIGPQEQTISTDLSRDRSFEAEFRK